MKVLGKYLGKNRGEYGTVEYVQNSYAVFEAEQIKVKAFSDNETDKYEYYLELAVGYLFADIRKLDNTFIDLESANSLVREFATKEIIDLEEYNLGFSWLGRENLEDVSVMNAFDDNEGYVIPLEVVIVDR